MSIKQDSYCRLEHFCCLELAGDKNLKPEKDLCYKTRDVYVEEYDDFISVKNRIIELTDLWFEKDPEQDLYPRFIVYNRFEDCKYVGVCDLKWHVSITFFGTILDYLEEKYGKEEGQRKYHREISKEKTWFFMISEDDVVSTCELISEEIADILFKEWLDNGQMAEETKKELFRREIEKRNY